MGLYFFKMYGGFKQISYLQKNTWDLRSPINHVDEFLDIFDPHPSCGQAWFFGRPPRKPCAFFKYSPARVIFSHYIQSSILRMVALFFRLYGTLSYILQCNRAIENYIHFRDVGVTSHTPPTLLWINGDTGCTSWISSWTRFSGGDDRP